MKSTWEYYNHFAVPQEDHKKGVLTPVRGLNESKNSAQQFLFSDCNTSPDGNVFIKSLDAFVEANENAIDLLLKSSSAFPWENNISNKIDELELSINVIDADSALSKVHSSFAALTKTVTLDASFETFCISPTFDKYVDSLEHLFQVEELYHSLSNQIWVELGDYCHKTDIQAPTDSVNWSIDAKFLRELLLAKQERINNRIKTVQRPPQKAIREIKFNIKSYFSAFFDIRLEFRKLVTFQFKILDDNSNN